MSPVRMPNKAIKAIASGREINLQDPGAPLVLIFHFRDTADIARKLNDIVREKYPSPQEILIASVLDLHSIPKIGRGATEAMVGREYKKAAGELKDDQKPEEIIIILPDWNGQMTNALGFQDTNKKAGIATIDASGYVLETYQEGSPQDVILSMVEKLLT